MVQIIQDFIPKDHNNRPGYAMNPTYITVHNTANTAAGANAKMHARYEKNPNTATSWHFTVDETEIYQHLPLNENGWHAGDGNGSGNRKSIGIEICENNDGDFEKAVANAQWLIKKLMKEQGISLANVVPHKHWSGKLCPRKLLDRWDSFKAGISGSSSSSSKTTTKETPKSSKASGSLKSKVNDLRFYSKPSWSDKDVVGTVDKGLGFPTVVEKVKVGNAYQYKVKNSKGATYYITAADEYVTVSGNIKKSTPAKSSNKTSSGIKSIGEIKIVGVKSSAIVMDKPDRNKAKNLGTVKLGDTISISGSVKGSNNPKGYWEVIYKGKRGYISGQYGRQV
ncbi:N-acetylmuramoyl-L-alanine amidase family protein [Bacillus atrophaeus]|uniref:peptidoglycan recognition protein family protein n=1 Tax=Bacillus atrophaeus TaxID=1452 RepID=UPI00227F6494|nr:N-acetylmuramoyl-L-alanine amidase family protein [Bacillus atrophaeus]MCY9198919.1 N-acetylmuramoyl-L-alanine amidase family protein [Bacillus atrophaeus]